MIISIKVLIGLSCNVYCIVVLIRVGLPGVLFVLPDSYVDPEYKDYGGKDLVFS